MRPSIKLYLLLSIIFNAFLVKADGTDSLFTKLKSASDKEKVEIYNEIAFKRYSVLRDSIEFFVEKSLELQKIYPSKREYVKSNILLALVESNRWLYEESLSRLFKTLTIAEEIKDSFLISRINNNIGVLYLELYDINSAEKFLLNAVKYKDCKEVMIGPVYNNLGLIKENQGDKKTAKIYYLEAEKIYIIKDDLIGLASVYTNMANLYMASKDFALAKEYLLKALRYAKEQNDNYRGATIKINIANLYLIESRFKKSLQLLNELEADTVKYYHIEVRTLIAQLKYLNYKQLRKSKEAYLYYNIYKESLKKQKNSNKQQIISELNVKYESEKLNKKIDLLNKEKAYNAEKINMRSMAINGLIIFIVLILVLGTIIYYQKRKQTLSYKELVKKNIEILNKEDEINEIKSTLGTPKLENDNSEFDKQNNLQEEQMLKIVDLINDAMINKKLYLDSELSLNKLSKILGINRTYISQTINDKFDRNYSSLINEYRVKEAQKLLIKETNLTYEGIGFEVGFKSKSAFNSAFKTYTGVTPSIFVKNAKLDN